MPAEVRFRLLLVAAALVSATARKDPVDPVAQRLPVASASLETAIPVSTTAELLAALSSTNAGRRILLRAGSPDAFARTNRRIDPSPAPEFFTSGDRR